MNKLIVNCETGHEENIEASPNDLATPPTIEQLLLEIRIRRTQLLTLCDWTQLPDSPITAEKKQEWITYRQLLRDMPETCDPYNPIWPITPL